MTPRTVLITGCSTGIGRACAQRLARAGHTVYATARRMESIEDLRAELASKTGENVRIARFARFEVGQE